MVAAARPGVPAVASASIADLKGFASEESTLRSTIFDSDSGCLGGAAAERIPSVRGILSAFGETNAPESYGFTGLVGRFPPDPLERHIAGRQAGPFRV